MELRICKCCGAEKPIIEFKPTASGYYTRTCKKCLVAYKKQWRKLNPDKERAQIKRYMEKCKNRTENDKLTYIRSLQPALRVKAKIDYPENILLLHCFKCDGVKPMDSFALAAARPTGRSNICRACLQQHTHNRNYLPTEQFYQCQRCGKTKPADQFRDRSSVIRGKHSYCLDCEKDVKEELLRRRTPEYQIEKLKEKSVLLACKHGLDLDKLWKKCSSCGEIKRPSDFSRNCRAIDGYQSICKRCRSASSETFAGFRRRIHAAVGHATTVGKLTRPDTCEECGCNAYTEAHHDNYLKPFDVRWLCRSCHRKVHLNYVFVEIRYFKEKGLTVEEVVRRAYPDAFDWVVVNPEDKNALVIVRVPPQLRELD